MNGGHYRVRLEFLFFDGRGKLCFSNYDRSHVDKLAAAFTFGESYSAINEGVKSVIFAHANVQTGMVNCATLTFDDVACFCKLATEYFDAESFAL